jgi:hypothetical protein
MNNNWRGWTLSLIAMLGLISVGAARAEPDSKMAPVSAYLMASRTAEIALARSAAPPSVSGAAEVMVLGPKGYVTAAKGANGFVCLVSRGWFSGVTEPDFWDPKLLGPICFNRQAARSVLPTFLSRTTWALSGASRAEISKRTRADMAAGKIPTPAVGAMTYMMSKGGYLGGGAKGPWHPHIMFYMPPMPSADWGANLAGTRIYSTPAGIDPYTMFYVTVAVWSDGTPDANAGAKHSM